MEENIYLQATAQSMGDMLHRVIGNTFIVDYGIIKAIPAEGVVTVETSVAENVEDTVITDCVLASFASSSISVKIKPNIDDKVLLLFPRKFHTDMFQKKENEPIITDVGTGYNVLTGIAVLLNQFQEGTHKNSIDFSDGCLQLKLAYNGSENLLTFKTTDKGEFILKSNAVEISADKDNVITVKNGKATITVDKDGNVTVDSKGKYTVKNSSTDLASVISALADQMENLVIVCPNGAGSIKPSSVADIETWKTTSLNALFNNSST